MSVEDLSRRMEKLESMIAEGLRASHGDITKLGLSVAKLSTQLEAVGGLMQQIQAKLDGNGRAGIIENLTRLEQRLAVVEGEYKSSRTMKQDTVKKIIEVIIALSLGAIAAKLMAS